MSKTILVDLSHPFGRGNPLWPSNGDFHIDRVQHMPMHYRLLQTFNDFHMHNSTHADSPSHVIPESPYTHELPLENYYGPAVCLDIPKKHWELITVEDIEKAAAKVEGGIQEGDWVLICTGMNQRWGENDDYFMYSPGMSIEGAHWLVDHKVKGVGFDLQALDHILYTYAAQHGPGPYVPRIVDEYKKEFGHEPIEDYPEWEPVHTILLGNNVMGIENLGGLQLPFCSAADQYTPYLYTRSGTSLLIWSSSVMATARTTEMLLQYRPHSSRPSWVSLVCCTMQV